MTEAEWKVCSDPIAMLDLILGEAGERKLRLFAVACCHNVGNLLNDEHFHRAVEVAERHADGLARKGNQCCSELFPVDISCATGVSN